MNIHFCISLFCVHVYALSAVATSVVAEVTRRPNVLFIAVDDLRPQLGCYGHAQMKTPNLDRLAGQGVRFDRSYCMVPTCGASRASLMTSIRPARNRFVTHLAWADKEVPDVITLNTHFKNHGYYTLSNGKVFHHPTDNAAGWSEPAWRPDRLSRYQLPENNAIVRQTGRGPAHETADVPDEQYADGALAEKAISDLRRLKDRDQPFFLAVGFFKPHLPFTAPKKYWDLYDHSQIHLADNHRPPQDVPAEGMHAWGELRSYAGIPQQGDLSEDQARALIHSYYACVSFTDAQIGKVLAELKSLGLDDNTIVILWGDHGWSLGEHTLWCKHSCFEIAMRTPLIVKAPNIARNGSTSGLTEFIDIYPSLCELTGLPIPSHVQGRSFVPLLHDPTQPWKESAVGRFLAGDTIRTETMRFTEYTDKGGEFVSNMLYDHRTDPTETVNLTTPGQVHESVKSLTTQLHKSMGKDSPSKELETVR